MSDVSHLARRHVRLRTHLADSFGPFIHQLMLLWQHWWRGGDRSTEAKLRDGGHVSLAHGFRLDGTTFVINRDDGTTLCRVPASQIKAIVDKGDYGYT